VKKSFFGCRTLWLGALLFSQAVSLRAGLISADVGKSVEQSQVDAAGTLVLQGYSFSAHAYYQNATDFNSGYMTFASLLSPVTLTASGTALTHQTGLYPSALALSGDYDIGPYIINATDTVHGHPPESAGFDYQQDLYVNNNPVLTAATYNGLQALNASQAFTLSFNAMSPNAGTNQSFVSVSILNQALTTTYFTSGELAPSTTSLLIPANTLLPDTSYVVQVTFDNRLNGTDVFSTGLPTSQVFESRTDVSFTTDSPVPEPAGTALLGLCFTGFLLWRRKARAN
jgi:hypothetical protein